MKPILRIINTKIEASYKQQYLILSFETPEHFVKAAYTLLDKNDRKVLKKLHKMLTDLLKHNEEIQ